MVRYGSSPPANWSPRASEPIFRKRFDWRRARSTFRPIDLATRQGGTTALHTPTLRVATPLFTPDGKPFGIIIANIDMRPALDRVRSTGGGADGDIYVVNSRGDYLVHPDRAREFGSVAGPPHRLAQ